MSFGELLLLIAWSLIEPIVNPIGWAERVAKRGLTLNALVAASTIFGFVVCITAHAWLFAVINGMYMVPDCLATKIAWDNSRDDDEG